jgi:hypothetical protein
MKPQESTTHDWLTVIKIAIAEDSPFKGMVDLTGIFKLPIATQQAIFDALLPEERDRLKELYGPKKAEGAK